MRFVWRWRSSGSLVNWPARCRLQSLIAATILLLLLLVIYQRGWIGGGDVKLLVALAIGLPLMGVIQMLTITALAGGVLALVHLMMRLLPYPRLAPAGSSLVRRVYAIERGAICDTHRCLTGSP